MMTPLVGEGANIISVLSQILIATLFAYDGWIYVGALAGEMKNPSKHLPMAIVGGISLVMAVYLIINVAYLRVVPASEMALVSAPATLVASKLFGPVGAKINKYRNINFCIWNIKWIYINRRKNSIYNGK